MRKMTMRERMLAVILQQELDRTPFVQYGNVTGFPSDNEAWDLVGRDNIGMLRWVTVHQFRTPNCCFETEDIVYNGLKGQRRVLRTPKGNLEEIRVFDPVLNSPAAASHFVKTVSDYEIFIAYLKDTTVEEHTDSFWQNVHELGEDGLPHVFTLRSPYQQLWIEWVDIQNLAAHLVEHADLMAEVIGLMTKVQTEIFQVACNVAKKAPIPYLVVADNITAPMVGEMYFRQYCVPAYNQLAEMLDESGLDIPVVVHMDGYLRPLWDAISESRVRGLDSMSPPPDNDTSVADALRMWPDMRLMINFPSSVHITEEENIYRAAMQILEEGGRSGRLQIQISENVPPGVWRKSYPMIVKAINDFHGGN